MAEELIKAVEHYFAELRDARRTGAGTPERTYYPAVANLLNAIGADLNGRVLCLSDLENTGAGHPDFGLFTSNQLQRGKPRTGQMPERGVIEMKPVEDDAWLKAKTEQVTRYFEAYRLVIVTNLRDFLIIGEAPNGRPERREHRLATDAASPACSSHNCRSGCPRRRARACAPPSRRSWRGSRARARSRMVGLHRESNLRQQSP